MLVVSQHVPPALRGIVIAGFMAAFMSTIATQLNWGASYLVSDFYRRFIKRDADDKHYVLISRLATVLLVIASAGISVLLSDIRSGWQVVLEVGAGTGGVYLLRWYWWRINAWSEISAMATALVVTIWLRWTVAFLRHEPGGLCQDGFGYDCGHDAGVADRYLRDQGGAGGCAGQVLPQRSAACHWMEAGCAPRARGAADPRSGAESAFVGSGLLHGLHGAVWTGTCAAGAVLGRDRAADGVGDLRRSAVFQYFAGRVERGRAGAACSGGADVWPLKALSPETIAALTVCHPERSDRFALRIGQRSRRIPCGCDA